MISLFHTLVVDLECKILPDWLGSIFSLEHMVLIGCKNLAYMHKLMTFSVTWPDYSTCPSIIAPRKDVLELTLNGSRTEWIKGEAVWSYIFKIIWVVSFLELNPLLWYSPLNQTNLYLSKRRLSQAKSAAMLSFSLHAFFKKNMCIYINVCNNLYSFYKLIKICQLWYDCHFFYYHDFTQLESKYNYNRKYM